MNVVTGVTKKEIITCREIPLPHNMVYTGAHKNGRSESINLIRQKEIFRSITDDISMIKHDSKSQSS